MSLTPAETEPLTPRDRQRLQTRQEILDAALAVMTQNGVAALNLSQVARRVGLRQPSLYTYFDSRTAVYDALFERGMTAHRDLLTAASKGTQGWAAVRAMSTATLNFTATQPVLAQFLFSRAVPGFVPSEAAYAPSQAVQMLFSAAVADAAESGELHPTAATPRGVALLIAIVGGIGSQQVANEPDTTDPTEGSYTQLIGAALDMYATFFDPHREEEWTPWP
ncbi:MAG TPA: TetR/AcrR family transcriptional regulator [Aldersonia sp.]